MERRKFLGLGLVAVAAVPASLSAVDFRKEKPDTWKAHKVDEAIKALYGDVKFEESDKLTVKTPKIASNGGAIPVNIKCELDVKNISLFQDSNPEAAVAVFEVVDGIIPVFMTKIKMAKSGSVTVVAEGKDGKFYKTSRKLDVALGGCEG